MVLISYSCYGELDLDSGRAHHGKPGRQCLAHTGSWPFKVKYVGGSHQEEEDNWVAQLMVLFRHRRQGFYASEGGQTMSHEKQATS